MNGRRHGVKTRGHGTRVHEQTRKIYTETDKTYLNTVVAWEVLVHVYSIRRSHGLESVGFEQQSLRHFAAGY